MNSAVVPFLRFGNTIVMTINITSITIGEDHAEFEFTGGRTLDLIGEEFEGFKNYANEFIPDLSNPHLIEILKMKFMNENKKQQNQQMTGTGTGTGIR
jgi:hypothetical protein